MKSLIILGRGVEGCGVTQCAIQMQKAIGSDILATSDKKWPRAKGLNFDHELFVMAQPFDDIVDKINNQYDLVVIYSIPSKGHPEECQKNFLEMIKCITTRKAFINVDHKAASISRNANLTEICNNVDVIMTHSMSNDFSKYVQKHKITTPLKKMSLGFDYDGHREKYWKHIEEQEANKVRWIGRTAMWKGPTLMIDFHENALMKNDFITILEGLEASIQYPLVLYRDNKEKNPVDRRKVVNYFRPEKHLDETGKFTLDLHGKEELGKGAYLYPQYNNVDCMERLSKSGFGADLYFLKAETYGNNIENCHAEIVACGAIPIFNKHFCDNVIHKVQGDPISKCINTGTIGLDATNFDECQNHMHALRQDDSMREDHREMAFEFWKQHSNGEDVVNEIVEMAMSDKKEKAGLEELFG